MNTTITTDALVKRLNRYFECQHRAYPKKFADLRVIEFQCEVGDSPEWVLLNFRNYRFSTSDLDDLAEQARTYGVLGDDELVQGESVAEAEVPAAREHVLTENEKNSLYQQSAHGAIELAKSLERGKA